MAGQRAVEYGAEGEGLGVYGGKRNGAGIRCWVLPLGSRHECDKSRRARSWGTGACGECTGRVAAGVCELLLLDDRADESDLHQRPFCNYYGLNFVLYELSTPFLNVHWFMDKLDMTGSTAQLVNGIVLITTFGASRLVWGTYQSVRMYQDIWTAFETPGGLPVPPWLAIAYVVSNTTLSALNFYWFGRMITAMKKRFEKPDGENDEKR